jgi:Entner-Doudoroff aldolase|tara:strand:- start:2965 stop:4602 length:1638 start_codon:yes stop_codon:yes gene_type:complete
MSGALRSLAKRAFTAATVAPRRAANVPYLLNTARALTGPASGGHISDELLEKLGTLSTQALIDGLWVMGWPTSHVMGARPLTEGQKKMVGRAITLQFAATRPDIAADKPAGMDSPEYEAFEACAGNKGVVVMSSIGPWESVGGDIKFLRLKQLECRGLVTDGSVRDTGVLREYAFPVFSHSTTPRQGPHVHQPWAANVVINCGGVVVRPGDAVIGDDDGCIIVPASHAQQVYDIAHSREVVEEIVKEELTKNPGPPGKFYPFMTGKIKPESPLGKLLTSKGVKFTHTAARPGARATTRSVVSPMNRYKTLGARRMSTRATHPFGRPEGHYVRTHLEMEKVLKEFEIHKACAVLRTGIDGAVLPAMDAAVAGGFRLAEFTLTTPGCLDAVAEYASNRPEVLTGVGTVLTVQDAKDAMDAGAKFIVSPCLIPEVVEWCAKNNIVSAPGCGTPTEMVQAFKLGAPIQKLFPGVAGGPGWVKAVSAALPFLRINPTSGVEIDTAADYLRSGAKSLGFVAPAFPPELVKNKDWDGISEIARKIHAAVASA